MVITEFDDCQTLSVTGMTMLACVTNWTMIYLIAACFNTTGFVRCKIDWVHKRFPY